MLGCATVRGWKALRAFAQPLTYSAYLSSITQHTSHVAHPQRNTRASIHIMMIPPKHSPSQNVAAVQSALQNDTPFFNGMCAIPDYQRLLYYTSDDRQANHHIDLSKAGSDELDALYRACKPAGFGRGVETIFDPSYRRAGKMDLTSFATQFDPRSLGIWEQVSNALLTQGHTTMDMKLYKLNVYGEGDFFKAHKDTPQAQDMFGSLVVVFPTPHEGGQFVLRQAKNEWTHDFASSLASATEPSVCFVAFYGDVEHEVLPVTSGHRVTLTYNLYRTPTHPSAPSIMTPFHLKLKEALVNLLNDPSTLPNGGYLGFGLTHNYVYTREDMLAPVLSQLKGSDRALADVCGALGLRYSFKLFYRNIGHTRLCLLTTKALDLPYSRYDPQMLSQENISITDHLEEALEDFTTTQVEGVNLVGAPPSALKEFSGQLCNNPPTEVLEVTPMESSVDDEVAMMTYGNESVLQYFYGSACMVVAVGPPASRYSPL